MKICWDNLEKLRYNQTTGRWYNDYISTNNKKRSRSYIYQDGCLNCGDPFLKQLGSIGKFCSAKCGDFWRRGKKHSEETISKMKRTAAGRKLTDEHKEKLREGKKGKNNVGWKGGVTKKNIPLYDTYAPQISYAEEVRRSKKNKEWLEVKCTWCGKWFVPITQNVQNRYYCLEGQPGYYGESRFYCSNSCKKCCPIWSKTAKELMNIDAAISGRLEWTKLTREVQPELRQMVFERDDYQCVKCDSYEYLHCHHLEGIQWEPLTSADMDMCITVCRECHGEIHKIPGCRPVDMRCNEF